MEGLIGQDVVVSINSDIAERYRIMYCDSEHLELRSYSSDGIKSINIRLAITMFKSDIHFDNSGFEPRKRLWEYPQDEAGSMSD